MPKSRKQHMEEWIIAALSASPDLAGVPIRTVDDDVRTPQQRLIVNAEDGGPRQLEGERCYPFSVQVELRSTNRDDLAVDAVFAAVEAAMKTPGANDDAVTRFRKLIFLDEEMGASDERQNNTRHRARKFPFLVLLTTD